MRKAVVNASMVTTITILPKLNPSLLASALDTADSWVGMSGFAALTTSDALYPPICVSGECGRAVVVSVCSPQMRMIKPRKRLLPEN
jgi:hypothetical protein